MAKSDDHGGSGLLAFNFTPILDLFMLATFVFAMNADVADKKYQEQYRQKLDAATNVVASAYNELQEERIKANAAQQEFSRQMEDAQFELARVDLERTEWKRNYILVSNDLEQVSIKNMRLLEEAAELEDKVKRLQKDAAEHERIATSRDEKVNELFALSNRQGSEIEEVRKDLDAAKHDNQLLEDVLSKNKEELKSLTKKLALSESALSVASNKVVAAVEQSKRDHEKMASDDMTIKRLRNQLEECAELQGKITKMEELLQRSSNSNSNQIIYVSAFCIHGDRFFWKNNHEWSSCSGKPGDGMVDFFGKKSIKRGKVDVIVNFIGFYNCRKRESSVVAKLKEIYGSTNVVENGRVGCHLIDMRNSNTVYLDDFTEGEVISYSELQTNLFNIAEEEREWRGAIKYYMVHPASESVSESTVSDFLKSAYRRDDVEIEVIQY